jgi:hypothetical protein
MHRLARLGCIVLGFASLACFLCVAVWPPEVAQFFQTRWFALVTGIWAGGSAVLWFAHLSAGFRSALGAFWDELRTMNKDLDRF